MTDAPEKIWTCAHVGEYGYYFPDATEAEGEYGGTGVEYTRSDTVKALYDCIDELTDRLARHNIAYRDICTVREQQQARIAELEAALAAKTLAELPAHMGMND